MPLTVDRDEGVRLEEEAEFDDLSPTLGSIERRIRYANGRWSFVDAIGEFDPRSAGSGTHIWDRTLAANLTVPADKTFATHDLVIADTVELTVSDTAEALFL